MRKKIDCHVHIRPEWLLGYHDKRMGLHFGPYGEITDDEGNFVRYYMPEYVQATKFTAESLLQVMNRHQIERAVILHSLFHVMNWDVVAAVNRYPQRFAGAMVIEPTDHALADIRKFHSVGLSAIKYEMGSFPRLYPDLKFDSPEMYKIWELAEELKLTVAIDTHPVGSPGYQVEELSRVTKDFPGMKLVICHAGFPDDCVWNNQERYERWARMIELANRDNVHLDCTALVDLFGSDVYPYPNVMRLMADVKRRVGAGRLLWGTDIPGTYQKATYRQMIDMFEKTDIFTEAEKDSMFYDNAEKLYFANRNGL